MTPSDANMPYGCPLTFVPKVRQVRSPSVGGQRDRHFSSISRISAAVFEIRRLVRQWNFLLDESKCSLLILAGPRANCELSLVKENSKTHNLISLSLAED